MWKKVKSEFFENMYSERIAYFLRLLIIILTRRGCNANEFFYGKWKSNLFYLKSKVVKNLLKCGDHKKTKNKTLKTSAVHINEDSTETNSTLFYFHFEMDGKFNFLTISFLNDLTQVTLNVASRWKTYFNFYQQKIFLLSYKTNFINIKA